MLTADGKKRCPRCGETKIAVGGFYKVNRKAGDGFAGYCIPCTKLNAVKWQKGNPEKKAASDRRQNDKPQRKADRKRRAREWEKANPEKARAKRRRNYKNGGRERSATWRAANKSKVQASQRKYHQKPEWKEMNKYRQRMRRATFTYQIEDAARRVTRKYGIEAAFTLVEWLKVIEAFGGGCAYCGVVIDGLELEHIDPLSRGGKHEIGNIAPSCRPCNLSKGSKTPEEFAAKNDVSFDPVDVRRRASLKN